ncbi:FARP1 protein, partial [Acromyrmex heyeri]
IMMNDIESFGMKGAGSKMPHSHSTPAGVDGGSRTPPATPRKAGKMLAVRVQMLDDSITMFQVQAKALGRVLFDQVCKQLHLLEADYFGLEYQEPNFTKYWLDLEKPVCRQVGLSLIDPLLRFCVKFYTPDPAQLEEEFTRYLFCLQIKRDLAQGLLQCNDNTAALMASYIVQAECGDYVIEDYPDHTYLSTYKFVPHQDQELERRIMENHKKHAGQSPAEADLNLLETARRCELYGMKMHPAKDHENVPLNLAVAHMGIVVFQNYTKINTFSWAKIRKISFKRKRFLIKLHPEGYGYYKDTVEFFFEGRNECKNFWKKCVENHGFFRCSVVKRVVRQKTRVLSRGSSFRYSGKTQKQIVEFVRDNYVKRQTFQRSNSFRQTSGGRALQGSEGGGYRGATPSSSLMGSSSISAHPLLPLGDPALATPAQSLSCGSMTLDSPTTVTSVSMGGTIHRREDTATSFRTLTSIDVHSPATPSQVPAQRQMHATSQQRISSTGRISPSNSSPPEFPLPRPLPRYPWQRSASCRELYASSFEDSGKARPRDDKVTADLTLDPFQLASQGELDNPITRYDESNRSYSAASSKLPSLDHDSVPERVYSSSYPGTSSLSTESGHEESGPAGDLSHDDLSHDSYELLEREHEFEYPESYSSPHDEPISDQSDEGIEHEMFQMDSETDSFVKHRSLKPSEKQQYRSAFTDLKNSKIKSIDRYSAVSKVDNDFVITESRIQRTGTQIERKFETRHANSVEQPPKTGIPHQDSVRKDPVVMQVQKQKMSVLNELKNLKPKYKITHVDSEVLRDEGIMRPKSRIDDDLSPVDGSRTLDHSAKGRTTRARSIASLDDHPPRLYVETGSLGRGHKSRDRKSRDADVKVEKVFIDRADMRELRRSIERLDVRERSYEHLDSREKSAFYYNDFYESRGKSVDRLDSQGLRSSMEHLKSPKEKSNHRHLERRERSIERIDSRETRKSRAASIDYDARHTLERFDSDNRSPFERLTPKEQRRMSIERLDSQKFDFDPRAIERLKSLERYEQRERTYERKIESRSAERKSLEKLDSRERKYLGRLESREGRSLECLDFDNVERRKNIERMEYKDQKKTRNKLEKSKPEEKPRERDDWRSLEKARKDDERRERERQVKLSIESRTETVIGVPHEMENLKSKTVFAEYEPKVVGGVVLGFEETALPGHVPVERTKSDPNPARQRLGSSNSKRHILMHQKSIDLTPADSGDEEPFSDSAAIQKNNVDIPYTLHKRHVMNGTASDEKSESDSSKTSRNVKSLAKDLPKLPLKMVTDLPYFDLTKLSSIEKASNKVSPDKPKSSTVTTARPKSILSPSDKPKSILSPTSKLSPTDPKSIVCSLSPSKRSPSKVKTQSPEKFSQKGGSLDRNKAEVIIEDYTCKKSSSLDKKPSKLSPVEPNITIISAIEKRSPKKSPTDPNITIVSVIQKKKSLDGAPRSPTSIAKAADAVKAALNFADIVSMEMKQNLERKAKIEKDSLKAPDDSLEKQDSIEKIPLPDIPGEQADEKTIIHIPATLEIKPAKPPIPEKPKTLEKPSIPEKTKRILERIESKFSEVSKNSATRISRPKIIDTGFDDFVDPVADLPLDEVPVKPTLELDSLKVPEFVPFMLRPHAEPIRSKSLSLAEEKAPIDTLLSPEVENKHFVQDVSPKRMRKVKSEPKKDFKKQSKSLEGDKPPLKKSASKESRSPSVSTKIDKSKLKLGEMPQEIIIIDSTDVAPEISIVQKGRSKSVTRLSDKPFSTSKEEKEETKTRAKSASVDDELIKGTIKSEKSRPKSLGISKSLGSTEKKDSVEKISPKRIKAAAKAAADKSAMAKEAMPKQDTKIARKEPSKEQISIKKTTLVQDLTQSPLVLRKPGQTPILFARARLGLSEGSGIGALQRQGATQSPTAQRRAKSLDAAVISVHRLPPANAFSSKDDTVDVSENLEDQENAAQGASTVSKVLSVQMEASPNHKSDSTDHTTVPEICTDSLSVTETSTQYLESPLTECNEIVPCVDFYEGQEGGQMPFVSSINGNRMQTSVIQNAKMEEATKFIDQSSAESGVEQEASQEKTNAKISETVSPKSSSPRPYDFHVRVEGSRSPSERDDVPDVTISAAREDMFFFNYDQDDPPDMVKSPIQISIEECSDDDMNQEEEEEEIVEVRVEDIDEREEEENKRLDSLDTSEDTLDALDTQVQTRGADSELSSPDYGIDKMDEKTLVEVELTPEYLEMKKEDEETAEELPEDEPTKETMEIADSNRLSIDRKLRLSTERSRSEETNTWTPDREDPDSSSCSIARPLGIGQIQPIIDRREIAMIEGARDSGSLDDDSNGTQPPPKQEMNVTWKSFPQGSSGSSSLEDGWVPQDESNAQQSQSEDSNGQNEDSFQEDLADFPGTFIIGPEILANYGAFSLSRTLSRISERSTTSEQDRSDLEDSFKPSSRSPSLDDESLMSSDHQPSLSSDPPSGTALPSVSDDRRTSSELPDIPIDVVGAHEEDSRSPRTTRRSRLQLQNSEDWPSPPSSPVFETPVVSHVETFYMEIKPEEAVKVTVTDSTETPVHAEQDSDSSDENRTLHDDLHSTLLEDGQSSTSMTTADGTVKIAVKPKSNSYITGSSHSEDTSMGLSMSEWSSSNNTVRQFCQYSGTKSDDNSLAELGASISDWSGSTTVIPQQYYATAVDKSQSDTTTSERSATSMRPNSKCQSADTSSLPSPPSPSSLPLPVSPPLPSPPETVTSTFLHEDEATGSMIKQHETLQAKTTIENDDDRLRKSQTHDEFDEARRFIESQFDEHHRLRRYDDEQQGICHQEFADTSPPRITLRNEYDEAIDDDFQMVPDEDTICVDDTALPIPEEDEEDQLYDNVPAMKYSSNEKIRMEVGRGDSSEDMHEKYADLTLQSRIPDDWLPEERRDVPEREKPSMKSTGKFDRGFSEPSPHETGRYQGTRSTERPVMVPIRAKSTPYYSTTSLSGESTTSSPPMPIKTQIRTKTMPCSSSRSPQSEGDTSSSMDSPAHTPDRGQRAFRRKRQQNAKRRHRVVVDLEIKDGHIISSTDSSFDVATIPPPLLPESQSLDVDDDEDDEMSLEMKDEHHRQQQR